MGAESECCIEACDGHEYGVEGVNVACTGKRGNTDPICIVIGILGLERGLCLRLEFEDPRSRKQGCYDSRLV